MYCTYNHVHVPFPLQWVPEITQCCPNIPFLLVGLQIDLREDKSLQAKAQLVAADAGEKLAHKLGAVKYVECSAITQKGLRNVIEEGFLAALSKEETEPIKRRGFFRMPKFFKSM